MHRNLSHEHANLVEESEDDDEEETVIELHRGTDSFSSTRQNGEAVHNPHGARSPSSPSRRMSSPNSRFRPPPSFEAQRHHASQESNAGQSHAIHLGQHETRSASNSISATAPLINKFQSVITATTQVVNHLDTVADSVAEAMSLLQHPFGGHQQQQGQHSRRKTSEREAYSIEPKLQEAREAHTRLKLQAFWQLLLTGFEVLKFAIGKRARKRILWLALDGRLYLTHAKNGKKPAKCIFLADIYKVQKGSEAQSFTKSQSWRDARGSGREQLCFSLHGNCGSGGSRRRQESTTSGSISGHGGNGEKTFALQVRVASVRNVLVENFDALLKKMKSDADGEFPFVAQKVIAQQFAATGAVLSLYQVEDILLREEDEKKSGVKDHHSSSSPDKIKSMNGGGLGVIDDDDSGDDDSEDQADQRDILG